MNTVAYLMILVSLLIVRGVTKGRQISDLPDDLSDFMSALVSFDSKAFAEVLARTGTSAAPAVGTTPDSSAASGAALVSPVTGKLGSAFGIRSGRLHAGQDIPLPVGTPVRAAMSGEVVAGFRDASAGTNVAIRHAGATVTRYLHLSTIAVPVGTKVAAGEVIGTSGNTGRSTGPHLHFGIEVAGVPVAPPAYYRARGVTLGA